MTNIAGWLFILVRKPFSMGDRVTKKPSSPLLFFNS
ncbi:MAG: hypothetical protein PF450_12190 [Bacteroidales bacterium]|nr:hypothetical protein [Bacteroidales bacterium]